jgi:hypothetical protein
VAGKMQSAHSESSQKKGMGHHSGFLGNTVESLQIRSKS